MTEKWVLCTICRGKTRTKIRPDTEAKRTVQQFHERLSQYEELGVTPEQIREMDRLYAEKCRETAELKRRIERMETSRKRQEKTSMEWAAHISGRFCKVE